MDTNIKEGDDEYVGPWIKVNNPAASHKYRVFVRNQDGSWKRIPSSISVPVMRGWRELSEYAGKTVEFFYVGMSMKNRLPIKIESIEVIPSVFGLDGLVDQDAKSKTVMNALEPKNPKYFDALKTRSATEEESLSLKKRLNLADGS